MGADVLDLLGGATDPDANWEEEGVINGGGGDIHGEGAGGGILQVSAAEVRCFFYMYTHMYLYVCVRVCVCVCVPFPAPGADLCKSVLTR